MPLSPQNGTSHIELTIETPEVIITRSAATNNECEINDAYALVFNGNTGKYKSGAKINVSTDLSGTNGSIQRTLTIKMRFNEGDKLVLLANTGVSSLPPFEEGVSTVADINNRFGAVSSGLFNRTGTDRGKGMPMSGETTLQAVGTTCVLKRSVAKIELTLNISSFVGIPVNNFNVGGVTWEMEGYCTKSALYSNTPDACVFPEGIEAGDFSSDPHTTENLDNFTTGAPDIVGITRASYLAEYPTATKAKLEPVTDKKWHKDRLCMLVRDAGGLFYRIDLIDRKTGKYLDIRRNTRYTVTITQVQKSGYTTAEEALANPGSNLEFIITEDNSNIVTGNDKYALILENDEVIACVDPTTEINVGAVYYKHFGTLEPGTVNKIEVTQGTATLTGATSVSETPDDIKLKLPGERAVIKITLGTLSRSIVVQRARKMSASGRIISFGKQVSANYTSVEWEKNECQVTITENRLENKLVLKCGDNSTPLNQAEMSDEAAVPIFKERFSSGYCLRTSTSSDARGRVKVIVEQGKPIYLGRFGGSRVNGEEVYSKRLIMESQDELEEGKQWGQAYADAALWDDGLANTFEIAGRNEELSKYLANHCRIKNDLNGNGSIDRNETINWYMPALDQLRVAYIIQKAIGEKEALRNEIYWSSTSIAPNKEIYAWTLSLFPSKEATISNLEINTEQHYVRCVREID